MRTRNKYLTGCAILAVVSIGAASFIAVRLIQSAVDSVNLYYIWGGIPLVLYTEAHEMYLPPMSESNYRVMFDLQEMYPYVQTTELLFENDPDKHFYYLSHVVRDEEELLLFARALEENLDVSGDIRIPDDWTQSPGKVLPRSRYDRENFRDHHVIYIQRPVKSFGRTRGLVQYFSGGLERMDYPSEFPMTEKCMQALARAEAARKKRMEEKP